MENYTMRLRPLSFLFLLAAVASTMVILPSARSAAASSGAPAGAQDQAIRVGVSVVNLYATVRDSHKRIITDLGKDDFHIFEDGTEPKVAFFSREKTLPLTMGILIDTSGSEQAMIGAEQQGATQFLQRVMQKKDEAMIMNFDLDVDLLADWTNDLSTLNRAIRGTRINTGGAGGQIAVGPVPTSQSGGTLFYDA